jgi:hypothetical protein
MSTIGCRAVEQVSISKQAMLENQINCSLRLNRDSFQIGDELALFFIIENLTAKSVYLSNSPYSGYYFDGKEPLEKYDIQVKNESGTTLDPTAVIDFKSGRYGITRIDPQGEIEVRSHDICKYGIADRKGVYEIALTKSFFVYQDKKHNRKPGDNQPTDFNTKILISKSEKITVEVQDID